MLALGVSRADDEPAKAKGKSDYDKLQGVWVDEQSRPSQVRIIDGTKITVVHSESRAFASGSFEMDSEKPLEQIDISIKGYGR